MNTQEAIKEEFLVMMASLVALYEKHTGEEVSLDVFFHAEEGTEPEQYCLMQGQGIFIQVNQGEAS